RKLSKLGWRRTIEFGLIFFLVILIFYLPFIGTGMKVIGSFGTFIQWSFNGPIFPVIWTVFDSYQLARIICYFGLALWIILVALAERDLTRGLFWTLGGAYLFFPTLYPWY